MKRSPRALLVTDGCGFVGIRTHDIQTTLFSHSPLKKVPVKCLDDAHSIIDLTNFDRNRKSGRDIEQPCPLFQNQPIGLSSATASSARYNNVRNGTLQILESAFDMTENPTCGTTSWELRSVSVVKRETVRSQCEFCHRFGADQLIDTLKADIFVLNGTKLF